MRRTSVAFAAVILHMGTASPWLGEVDRADDGVYLDVAGHRITHVVLASIQDASRRTGVSFSYLMAQAGRESAFRSDAGSRLSSAAGLYQFTASTWLMMIRQHGPRYGLDELAAQISVDRRGNYVVDGAAARARILELRRDPRLSAVMAGEYAKDNRDYLERALGRPVNTTDLYLAHFLGPYGAERFLLAKARQPGQPAVRAVNSAAARNNAPIFYDKRRRARTVAQVYDMVHDIIDRPMEHFAHLEDARAWAAAWTETIETGSNRVIATMPPRRFEAPPPPPTAKPDYGVQMAADHFPPVPAPKPSAQVLLAGRFVPPVPAAKPDPSAPPPPAFVQYAMAFGPPPPPLALPGDAPPSRAVEPTPAVMTLAFDDLAVSAARIERPMPPPAGAAVPEIARPRPFGWFLAPLRELFGRDA